MEAASTLTRPVLLEFARRIDWGAVSTWLLGFGLVAYLGLEGGGFDPWPSPPPTPSRARCCWRSPPPASPAPAPSPPADALNLNA